MVFIGDFLWGFNSQLKRALFKFQGLAPILRLGSLGKGYSLCGNYLMRRYFIVNKGFSLRGSFFCKEFLRTKGDNYRDVSFLIGKKVWPFRIESITILFSLLTMFV